MFPHDSNTQFCTPTKPNYLELKQMMYIQDESSYQLLIHTFGSRDLPQTKSKQLEIKSSFRRTEKIISVFFRAFSDEVGVRPLQ